MSVSNKVVWSEGLFLQPQHFQQQDRYLERYVETRCQALIPHSWGFTEIEIERDFLSIGKFGLRRAPGVFPDGTPFRMPDDDPLPAPIDIGAQRARSDRCIWPCRCAAPASSKSIARRTPTGWRATTSASGRRATRRRRRRRPGAARSRRAAHAAPAGERGDRRRMRACRWRTSSSAAPTSRSCSTSGSCRPCCTSRAATRLATFIDRAARAAASARRGARRPGGGDRPGRRRGDRRLPDAAGDQPLRAAVRALRGVGRAASRGAVSALRVGGRRAGHVHDDRRSGRRRSRATGTSGCASRSSR